MDVPYLGEQVAHLGLNLVCKATLLYIDGVGNTIVLVRQKGLKIWEFWHAERNMLVM